ncbi:hypothetical protein CK203_018792 [Vitis vinifera]|uniref:Uncharacterized protein n=1 Tax=Vitis vinifera TaxID=29760 RepID=A0A438JAL3_VITVI|nr:hypothetical protein CK203_018792 [Vitis vinifera]
MGVDRERRKDEEEEKMKPCQDDKGALEVLSSFHSQLLCFVCVGFDFIIKKLRDLVPVLINCFHEFIPLVHATMHLDAQSFDCMLYILQSIDLAVRFFVYGTGKSQPGLCSSIHPYEGPDMTMWDQDVSPVVLKKLLVVFPLNPRHDLSEKDGDRYFILNVVITEIFLHLSEWSYPPPDLLEIFLEFIENALSGKV